MKLGSITQALQEQAAMRKPATDVGSEPLTVTPGQSFDAGPMVDDANVHDAGGYPDTSALTEPDRHKPEAVPPRRRRPLRRFTTQRFSFDATTTGPAVLVTPSGIDALDIVYVNLTCSVAGRVRYGSSDNNAAAGAFLGNTNGPTTIEASPEWLYPVAGGSNTTEDVLVVYEDPTEMDHGTTPGKPCGCDK